MRVIREIFENLRMSFSSIFSNFLRSTLASLGVMIGISIVIIMGWILDGLDTSVMKTFEIIGRDMIYVTKWDWTGQTNWKFLRSRKNLTLEDAEKLKAMNESAEFIIPNINRWGVNILYDGNQYSGFSAVGTPYENTNTPAGETIHGRYFSMYEDAQGEHVIVIGYNVYKNVFEEKNPVGKYIKMGKFKYKIVGVVKKRGTLIFDFIDNQVFLPINSFIRNYGVKRRSVDIAIKAGNIENLDYVRSQVIGQMRSIRNLGPEEDQDFSINETKAFEENIKEIRFYVWLIGISLTSLAFVVGIIGIMNIMFVSVTERTKEIGLRKSLGAKKRSIFQQFIIESGALTLGGAFIAILFCTVFINLIRIIVPSIVPEISEILEFFPPYLNQTQIILASSISIFVGVMAGLIPAINAAGLDPVDALRSE